MATGQFKCSFYVTNSPLSVTNIAEMAMIYIKLTSLNSLHAMGTFMCLYKIEKTMYFILTSNIKNPYKFT